MAQKFFLFNTELKLKIFRFIANDYLFRFLTKLKLLKRCGVLCCGKYSMNILALVALKDAGPLEGTITLSGNYPALD